MKRYFVLLSAAVLCPWGVVSGQSGALDQMFAPQLASPSGALIVVHALAMQLDGKIVIGGQFETVNGEYRFRIARLLPSGSVDPGFQFVDPDNRVRGLDLDSLGNIYVCGVFRNVNGDRRRGVFRVNSIGDLDPAFPSGQPNTSSIFAIQVLQDQSVIFAGTFSEVADELRDGIARLTSAGDLDRTFVPQSTVQTLFYQVSQQSNGRVIVAGHFVSDEFGYYTIAALNENGTLDTNFHRLPLTTDLITVTTIAIQPDDKIVYGPKIGRLEADGRPDTNFVAEPGANGAVNAIALQPDGKIVVAGNFTTFHGIPRNRIARLNSDGTVDLSFDPGLGANTNVNALAIQADGKILFGGDFASVGGQPRTQIARLHGDRPTLASSRIAGEQITLRWPTPYSNFVPQMTTRLSATNWVTLTNAPVREGHELVVTNTLDSSNQFFRLVRPAEP